MGGGNPTPHYIPNRILQIDLCAIDDINLERLVPSQSYRFLGGYAEGATPVPIPNTEVKPLRADGTAWVAVWESRSPPGSFTRKPHLNPEMGLSCVLMIVFEKSGLSI
jgi:hypothetical protein